MGPVATGTVQAPGVYQGAANVIAAVMLLIEFGMLRQALARDQVRLYAAQSALISVLAVVIAADRNLPDLAWRAGSPACPPPTPCCWPNAPRASPRSPTPWPSATPSSGSRAASRP